MSVNSSLCTLSSAMILILLVSLTGFLFLSHLTGLLGFVSSHSRVADSFSYVCTSVKGLLNSAGSSVDKIKSFHEIMDNSFSSNFVKPACTDR